MTIGRRDKRRVTCHPEVTCVIGYCVPTEVLSLNLECIPTPLLLMLNLTPFNQFQWYNDNVCVEYKVPAKEITRGGSVSVAEMSALSLKCCDQPVTALNRVG